MPRVCVPLALVICHANLTTRPHRLAHVLQQQLLLPPSHETQAVELSVVRIYDLELLRTYHSFGQRPHNEMLVCSLDLVSLSTVPAGFSHTPTAPKVSQPHQ